MFRRASCNSLAERTAVAKQWRQEAQLIEHSMELVMSHKTSDVTGALKLRCLKGTITSSLQRRALIRST